MASIGKAETARLSRVGVPKALIQRALRGAFSMREMGGVDMWILLVLLILSIIAGGMCYDDATKYISDYVNHKFDDE